jgi:hypothetical protein
MEDEDEDEDEDSPSWFLEEEDEHMINPNATDPDVPDDISPEDLSHFIRIDESKLDYGQFRFDR